MSNENEELLKGVRVLDFTWSVSGSMTTRILASMGAEVIKVEWPKTPDAMRFSMYAEGDEPGLDNGVFFNNLNAGKRGVTLNVKSDKGREIIESLIQECDVVTENFSAEVFEKWGLGYDSLKKINPQIIYMSISGLGHTGRNRLYGTWGPTAAALSGMTFTSGLPGEPPCGWGYSILDLVAGYSGAVSVLNALYYKAKTGEGQYVDISQVETGLPLCGLSLLDFTVNDRASDKLAFPPGNHSVIAGAPPGTAYRGPEGCPHNVYRCKGEGDNDWCVIAIFNNEEWEAFKQAIGTPSWTTLEKFNTFQSRVENQEELDLLVQSFTIDKDKYEVMDLMQAYGVPCGAVQMNEDIVENDQQLRSRGFFERRTHPLLGERYIEGVPIKMNQGQPYIHSASPLMGEHNEYVLGDILGYSSAEIRKMYEAGVLWPADMPRDEFKVVRPLW